MHSEWCIVGSEQDGILSDLWRMQLKSKTRIVNAVSGVVY